MILECAIMVDLYAVCSDNTRWDIYNAIQEMKLGWAFPLNLREDANLQHPLLVELSNILQHRYHLHEQIVWIKI